MILPKLILLSDYDPEKYIDVIYNIFKVTVVNQKLTFLGLPITSPWHPPHEDKHFCFWHLITDKFDGKNEEDRFPDTQRCERIRWIAYTIEHANDASKVWCWEKEVKTKRGRSSHIVLYLHEENYVVILRKKKNRLELVTAYVKQNAQMMCKERMKHVDPRVLYNLSSQSKKAEVALATSGTPSTTR